MRPISLLTLALAGVLAATSAPAQSDPQPDPETDRCRAFVNGSEIVVTYAPDRVEATRRERAMSWPGRAWNRAWGTPPDCPSEVVITYLAVTVPEAQTEGYCLAASGADGSFLLVPGERNFRGRCRRTTCEVVDTTKDQALALAAGMARRATGQEEEEAPGGASLVSHASGALLATGTGGTVTALLQSLGGTVAGAVSTPALLTAGAVTVVALGGAVYVCSE